MPLIKLDDCSLEYFTCGSKTAEDGSPAPVITWVHGAGGNAFTFWANTPGFVTSSVPFHAPGLPESSAPLSKKAYYCIMISMRGWGGSRIHAKDPVQVFSAAHFAADLLAVLDAEGVEETALVCHSFGGTVGVHTAFTAPERVTALVMVSTTFGLLFSESAEDRLQKDFLEAWNFGGMKQDFDYSKLLAQVQGRLSDDALRARPFVDMDGRLQAGCYLWMKKAPEVWNLRTLLHQANVQVKEMGCMAPPPRSAEDPMLKIYYDESKTDAELREKFLGPISFICPADDAAVPWEFCALMAERLGGSIDVMESSLGDHSVMMFSPAEFNASVRSALERV